MQTPLAVLKDLPGWAIEAHDPRGGVDLYGFHRDEATAWQEAQRLARTCGWKAERNSVAAERLVAGWRR